VKRRAAFEVCGRIGLPGLILRAGRRLRPRWLAVLAYHRIAEVDPDSPWDPELISVTPDEFRRQLAFLKRHFRPVTSEEVVRWKRGEFAMPANPVVVTFDDGYLDNYRVALPLLQEALVGQDRVLPSADPAAGGGVDLSRAGAAGPGHGRRTTGRATHPAQAGEADARAADFHADR